VESNGQELGNPPLWILNHSRSDRTARASTNYQRTHPRTLPSNTRTPTIPSRISIFHPPTIDSVPSLSLRSVNQTDVPTHPAQNPLKGNERMATPPRIYNANSCRFHRETNFNNPTARRYIYRIIYPNRVIHTDDPGRKRTQYLRVSVQTQTPVTSGPTDAHWTHTERDA